MTANHTPTPLLTDVWDMESEIQSLRARIAELEAVLREAFDARGCHSKCDDGSVVLTSEWVEHARAALAKGQS